MGDLLRLLRGDVVDPDVAGGVGPIVVVEQLRSIARVGQGIAAQRIEARLDGEGLGVMSDNVVGINTGVAVEVGGPGERLAVWGEGARAQLPLLAGQPINLLVRDID